MTAKVGIDQVFGRRLTYPDPDARDRYGKLVGIDSQKERLYKVLSILINPHSLETWAKKFHPKAHGLANIVMERPPLAVLAGDVGCGKTALAESRLATPLRVNTRLTSRSSRSVFQPVARVESVR